MPKLDRYAKAFGAALAAALGAYQIALLSPGVTASEWAGIALAALGGLGITYLVPNAPAPTKPSVKVTVDGPGALAGLRGQEASTQRATGGPAGRTDEILNHARDWYGPPPEGDDPGSLVRP